MEVSLLSPFLCICWWCVDRLFTCAGCFSTPATLLSLSSSFPICITLISFFCLIALASVSSTILKGSGGNEYHFLIPDFGGIVSNFSPLCVGVLYIAFIMLNYVPSSPTFSRTFYHECIFLSKAFSVSIMSM